MKRNMTCMSELLLLKGNNITQQLVNILTQLNTYIFQYLSKEYISQISWKIQLETSLIIQQLWLGALTPCKEQCLILKLIVLTKFGCCIAHLYALQLSKILTKIQPITSRYSQEGTNLYQVMFVPIFQLRLARSLLLFNARFLASTVKVSLSHKEFIQLLIE